MKSFNFTLGNGGGHYFYDTEDRLVYKYDPDKGWRLPKKLSKRNARANIEAGRWVVNKVFRKEEDYFP